MSCLRFNCLNRFSGQGEYYWKANHDPLHISVTACLQPPSIVTDPVHRCYFGSYQQFDPTALTLFAAQVPSGFGRLSYETKQIIDPCLLVCVLNWSQRYDLSFNFKGK